MSWVGREDLIEGGSLFLFLSLKVKKRAQKRKELNKSFSDYVRGYKTNLKENCTHLFSGAHIGHSLSVSAYPSKQLRKKCTKVKGNHDHVKPTSMSRVLLTFGEMNVDTGNERLAGPKVGSTHCTLRLGISSR